MEGDAGKDGLGFEAGNKGSKNPILNNCMGNKEHSRLGRKWRTFCNTFGYNHRLGLVVWSMALGQPSP